MTQRCSKIPQLMFTHGDMDGYSPTNNLVGKRISHTGIVVLSRMRLDLSGVSAERSILSVAALGWSITSLGPLRLNRTRAEFVLR